MEKKCSKPPTRYWLYWTRLKRQDLQFASRVVSGRSGRLRWWDDSEHLVANYPRLVVVGYNHSDWCGLSYNQLLVITFTCCVGYNHSYKWTTQLLTRSLSHVNHWGYNPLTSRGMSHQGEATWSNIPKIIQTYPKTAFYQVAIAGSWDDVAGLCIPHFSFILWALLTVVSVNHVVRFQKKRSILARCCTLIQVLIHCFNEASMRNNSYQ